MFLIVVNSFLMTCVIESKLACAAATAGSLLNAFFSAPCGQSCHFLGIKLTKIAAGIGSKSGEVSLPCGIGRSR